MPRLFGMLMLVLILTPALAAQEKPPDYQQWQAACAKLPSNRELKGRPPDKSLLPLRSFAEFEQLLDAFLNGETQGRLAQEKSWVGQAPDFKLFFDFQRTWYGDHNVPFQPFAQKLVLPGDAVAIIMGDLHGDIRSLMRFLDELNNQKILDGFHLRGPKHHLIFLGDFCDRGQYGTEVLYTLLRLKAANSAQVHLARGNHEDFHIVARYGFLDELRHKFGQKANITKLMRSFDLLPVVIYVGNGRDFLQMNHGGMEPGYDPRGLLAAEGLLRYELLGKLRQKSFHLANHGWVGKDPKALAIAERHLRDFIPQSPTSPRPLGFLWNDFTVFADDPALGYDRALLIGAGPTRHLLARASSDKIRVRAVVRAHQHTPDPNPLMRRLVAQEGIFRHWQEREIVANEDDSVGAIRKRLGADKERTIPDGSVWTFNVSPDSWYGVGCGFDFVTAGILTFAPEFKDWRMRVLKINVFPR